jgi:hypothetical protein
MLRHKSTTTISELKKYFGSNEKSVQTLLTVFRSLRLSGKTFQAVDKKNSRYSGLQKFMLLIWKKRMLRFLVVLGSVLGVLNGIIPFFTPATSLVEPLC